MPAEIHLAVNEFLANYGWPPSKEVLHAFRLHRKVVEHACYYCRTKGIELQFLTSSPGDYTNYMIAIRLIKQKLRTGKAFRVTMVNNQFRITDGPSSDLLNFHLYKDRAWVSAHTGDFLIDDS